ncbi:permease-like cell division protein FtsX [Geobacter pelophilus]|uniref:Cell division protein FtsX n=2 Tax=Geoanaerobacter pelophilus TaxID=60036 RepID=A0AAW4KVT9_9BACT|nr:permease-like cell division protein FtsX [Geoanaerobacter pelophilus]MBT0662779.1 permease-like cell division protein FtsX [Geoanaerobacter pelophilus]
MATRQRVSNPSVFGRLRYFIGRAVLNIKQNIFINLVTMLTIAIGLLIIAVFLLLLVNLEGVAHEWTRQVQVTVYLEKEPASQELSQIVSRIKSLQYTDSVNFITKEDALKRFRARLRGQESLMEGVTADLLPASIEITLKKGGRDSESVESFVSRLKQIPGVSEVQYGEEWVRKLTTFMQLARFVVTLIGGFLLISVLFIVSNTIKLTIYARKDELEILSLVGATRFFIKAPFLIEGIIQGFVGSLLALILLSASYYTFLYNAADFLRLTPTSSGLQFLPLSYLAVILFAGILLGFIGSLASLKRFITF